MRIPSGRAIRMRKLKNLKGGAMIEMALVVPILTLILIGIIEFSVIFYDKAIITNASREGARYGIVLRKPTYASAASVISFTQAYCSNKLISFSSTPASAVVTVTSSTTTPVFGDSLTVKVSYTYSSLLLYKLVNLGQQINLSATTAMAYE